MGMGSPNSCLLYTSYPLAKQNRTRMISTHVPRVVRKCKRRQRLSPTGRDGESVYSPLTLRRRAASGENFGAFLVYRAGGTGKFRPHVRVKPRFERRNILPTYAADLDVYKRQARP